MSVSDEEVNQLLDHAARSSAYKCQGDAEPVSKGAHQRFPDECPNETVSRAKSRLSAAV